MTITLLTNNEYICAIQTTKDIFRSNRRIVLRFVYMSFVFPMVMENVTSRIRLVGGYTRHAHCLTILLIDYIRANLERELKPFIGEAEGYESSINFSFNIDEPVKHFSPYIGNGKFGLPLDQDSPFHIKGKRALNLVLPFYPRIIVDTLSPNEQSKGSYIRVKDLKLFSFRCRRCTLY